MAVVEEMLDMMGLESERFQLAWCSSAEAERFAGAVRDMTETVKELGPSPYRVILPPSEGESESVPCRSQ